MHDAKDIAKKLIYDPETGLFIWRERSISDFSGEHPDRYCSLWNGRYAGQPALTYKMKNGYLTGRLNDKGLLAHRAAFAIMTGEMPKDQVDHINGQRDDNRWVNIRAASRSQNGMNRGSIDGSASKYKGVTWHPENKKWIAALSTNGRRYYLGSFLSEWEAAQAYNTEAFSRFGAHAKLNVERIAA